MPLAGLFDRIAARLEDDWRSAWRWWSVQMHVVGTLVAALLIMVPSMPPELQQLLPTPARAGLVAVWAMAGLAARLVKQRTASNG